MKISEEEKYHIQQISNSINEIVAYTKQMDRNTFNTAEETRTIILRNLAAVGEASRLLSDETLETTFGDTDMRVFHNFTTVMHDEELEMNMDALWQIVKYDLPLINDQIQTAKETYTLG